MIYITNIGRDTIFRINLNVVTKVVCKNSNTKLYSFDEHYANPQQINTIKDIYKLKSNEQEFNKLAVAAIHSIAKKIQLPL